MKNLWLLPDIQQSGEITVLDGAERTTIGKSLDGLLRELPKAFVLGVPELVLRDHPDERFIYSQFARMPSKSAFACSMRAGKDRSERTVYLTNLQILERNEDPVQPHANEAAEKQIVDYMNRMAEIFHDKNISANTSKMLEKVKANTRFKSFASEHPRDAAIKPEWWPGKEKKKLYRILAALAAILFLIKLVFS